MILKCTVSKLTYTSRSYRGCSNISQVDQLATDVKFLLVHLCLAQEFHNSLTSYVPGNDFLWSSHKLMGNDTVISYLFSLELLTSCYILYIKTSDKSQFMNYLNVKNTGTKTTESVVIRQLKVIQSQILNIPEQYVWVSLKEFSFGRQTSPFLDI